MRILILTASLTCTAAFAAPPSTDPGPPGPDDEVETLELGSIDIGKEWTLFPVEQLPRSLKRQVKRSIKLLEKQAYLEVLEALIHPDDRARMPDLSVVVDRFSGTKAERLLAALQAVPDCSTYRALHTDGSTRWVVAVRERVENLPDDLVFERVGKDWRLID